MGLKIWSLHYYSKTIQRKWLDPGRTTAFHSRPNSTNYCHFKCKIQVSHSEKLLLGGPKNTLLYLQLGPRQIITHHSTQLPTKIVPNYPITQSYPKLPKVTQLPKNNQYYSRLSIFLGIILVIPRTTLFVQGITQIALLLLVLLFKVYFCETQYLLYWLCLETQGCEVKWKLFSEKALWNTMRYRTRSFKSTRNTKWYNCSLKTNTIPGGMKLFSEN